MNRTRLSIIMCGLLTAAVATAKTPQVSVQWVHPEKYTDVQETIGAPDKHRGQILARLEAHLRREAKRYLAPDQRLEVEVLDVDLAGHVWPVEGQDRRIVRDIDFPKIVLRYRLYEGDNMVAQDTVTLKDMDFLRRVPKKTPADGLRFEKRLLSDWLRQLSQKTQVAHQ